MIRHDARHWIGRARREGWALGMFNAHHLEAVQAIAAAAATLQAPVMLGTTMGGLRHVGLDYFVTMAETARRRTAVPLLLHLDHGADLETVRACIDAGFESVMIDASARDYDSNVELVRSVVDLARRHGVGVEAQIGQNLAEEGPASAERLTDPDEACRFVADTGIDYLAVSVGSTPGRLAAASIDAARIAAIAAATAVPLVLHGGTSIRPSAVGAAIARGVAKINIDAAVKAAFREALTRYYKIAEPELDTRLPLAAARTRAQAEVEARLRLFGAVGRAT